MERNETLVTSEVKTRIVMLYNATLELKVQLIRCIPPRAQSFNYLFPSCHKSSFLYSSPQEDRLLIRLTNKRLIHSKEGGREEEEEEDERDVLLLLICINESPDVRRV